uniref:Uncharacterized protein n=1 Tax=Meloidogyne enterolobii TaxID=390850 RepID=A0A6V7TIF9_MELEN|nr:unnamed protein product [Meloidogyne enterolobii]
MGSEKMKNSLIIVLIMIVLIGSVNGDHCSILKLNCEKYCHYTCGYDSGDTVVCKIIKSICDYIGCCHHEDD